VFLALFGFLSVLAPAMAQLSYEGSSSMGEKLIPELARAFTAKGGASFSTFVSNDSAAGFKAVRDGKAVLGGMSRLMSGEELQVGLGNQVIGYDALVVYVNHANPVKSLTGDQLRKIFLGIITNWKDVGGVDSPIVTLLREGDDEGGTARQFRELVLGGETFASPSLRLPTYKAVIEYVTENQTAISFGSLAFDEKIGRILPIEGIAPTPQSLNSGQYPLSRPYVLVFQNSSDNKDLKAFLEFTLSKEGQAIVKTYVIPVMTFGE